MQNKKNNFSGYISLKNFAPALEAMHEITSSIKYIDSKFELRIINNNFDAIKYENGDILGIYDGIAIESNQGINHQNVHQDIIASTGLSACWNKSKRELYLLSSTSSSRKFFYRKYENGVQFSSNLYDLLNKDSKLKDTGLAQLLIYGSAAYNDSMFPNVKAVDLGTCVKFSFATDKIIEDRMSLLKLGGPEKEDFSYDEFQDVLKQKLEANLNSLKERPIALLLSGGVDSTLMASLMDEDMRQNITAFTCSFGRNDPDTVYSKKFAEILNLKHHVIEISQNDAKNIMESFADRYSYPFGDFSSIPSYYIIEKMMDYVSPGTYILDGTAGDALFGFGGLLRIKRNRVFWKLPNWIKLLCSSIYNKCNLWNNNDILSRGVSFTAAALTPNPQLIGIHLTPMAGNLDINRQVLFNAGNLIFEAAKQIMHTDISDELLLTSLDLLNTCGGLYAAKVADPAREFGCAVEFPYMWPDIMDLGFQVPLEFKIYNGIVKYPLKNILSKYIPKEYIYRNKTGFVPPLKEWLMSDSIYEEFKKTCLGSDITNKIELNTEKVFRKIKEQEHRPTSIYSLLWTIYFYEKWKSRRVV